MISTECKIDMTKQQRKPDRRIRRTRRQLHSALHHLIKQTPYDSLTISDIVEEADISRATFYLHYKDKDELLLGSLEALSQSLIEQLAPSETSPLELHTFAHHIYVHVKKQQKLYIALQSSYTASFVIQHHIEQLVVIVEGMLGHIAPELPSANQVAHQLIGMLYGQILWWLKHDLKPSAGDMAQAFETFALQGIAGMKN